jgi:hypothetical protein
MIIEDDGISVVHGDALYPPRHFELIRQIGLGTFRAGGMHNIALDNLSVSYS